MVVGDRADVRVVGHLRALPQAQVVDAWCQRHRRLQVCIEETAQVFMNRRSGAATVRSRCPEDVIVLVDLVVACKLQVTRHVGPYHHIRRRVVLGILIASMDSH